MWIMGMSIGPRTSLTSSDVYTTDKSSNSNPLIFCYDHTCLILGPLLLLLALAVKLSEIIF